MVLMDALPAPRVVLLKRVPLLIGGSNVTIASISFVLCLRQNSASGLGATMQRKTRRASRRADPKERRECWTRSACWLSPLLHIDSSELTHRGPDAPFNILIQLHR